MFKGHNRNNIQIIEDLIPRSDIIFIPFGKVNYEDRFCLILENKKIFDVDFIIVKLIKSIPKWFKFLLNLRNVIASIFGLKTSKIENIYENPEKIKIRTLKEEFNRVFRSRVLNPKWLEAMREHGYKGAFEMAATVDYLFGYDATCDIVADYQYEEVANKLLLDPEQQKFFRENNPLALRDASQRLLEAKEREMWENVDPKTLEALEFTILEIQGEVE